MAGFAAVVCGGGVAGVEGLLRLRKLAGDQLDVTLIDASEHLVYRPLTVLEPFAEGAVRRYPVQQVVDDTGVAWIRDALSFVDRNGRVVHTNDGREIPYDALLLAVGGRARRTSEHALVLTAHDGPARYRRVLAGVAAGTVTKLALVLPDGPGWPLPLYEIALLTAHYADERGRSVDLSIVTPEPAPLAAFGAEAGAAMSELLRQAGIRLHTSKHGEIAGPGRVTLRPGDVELPADQIVTLPVITGPNVRGIPGEGLDRFLAVDEYCRVLDTDGTVFAAGDATDLPVKQGGVGAQQADTAAAGIAHLAGLADPPQRSRPLIQATLLTGARPLYLAAHLIAGRGWQARVYDEPPWPAGQKVVAEELGPYLDRFDAAGAR